MPERDEIGRSLALAKSALGPPPAARARVRARLTAAGPAAVASSRDVSTARAAAARSGARALARAFAWASLGLCAGYWLGFHRVGAPAAEPARTAQEVPASAATGPALAAPNARPEAVSSGADAWAGAERAMAGSTDGHSAGEAVTENVETGASDVASERVRPPARGAPPRRHRSGVVAPRSPRSERTLAAEIALLERAERAIRAGEGQLALVLLDQLEREFPASTLHQERAAARVLARCTEARSAGPAERVAARARAEQFLADGSSVYAERVRELCALDEQN